MDLIVQGKGLEVTDHLREYVQKKVDKLDRFLSAGEARMELSNEKTRSYQDRQVAQLTIRTSRAILRAEERTGDIFTSVDMVMDKIKRQIDRYKRKRRSRSKGRGAPPMEMVPEEALDVAETSEQGNIVRVKRFVATPMDADEAIEQMELLGHDFFVFFNVEEGQINVIYRRHDDNYGLLQPETA